MIRYKLTDQNMRTYNNTQWVLNEEKHTNGTSVLCSSGWLHCYSHPLLAMLLNPIHSNINNPRLFKVIATGNHKYNKGLKEGCTTLKLIKELSIPIITLNQKIAFGILCSLKVYKDKNYIIWANNWLNDKNRTTNAATYAADAATYAADAAADAAYAATYATYAATYAAAYAAAYAANAAANAAAYADAAAYAAAYAAAAADAAADAANVINNNFNLISIAKEALKYN